MQLNLIFVTTLLLVNCKASDVGINMNPYNSNIDGYKVTEKAAVNQQSLTSSALNTLADIIAKGGNYIIDASSMGGGILIGQNGNLQPYGSQTIGKYRTDGTTPISSQLLQNLRDPGLQKQSNPVMTFTTNSPLKVFPKLTMKPQSISSPRKPQFSIRPVSKQVVRPMQTSLRKYKPINVRYTIKDVNSLAQVMPDFTLLKFLDLYSNNYEDELFEL